MIAYAVVLRPEEDTPDPNSTGLKKYVGADFYIFDKQKFPLCFDFESVILIVCKFITTPAKMY